MKLLTLGNIQLPKELQDVWICSKIEDVETCQRKGFKYIYYKGTSLDLIKWILYKPLSKLYPYIDWKEIWNIKGKCQPKIRWTAGTQSESYRDFNSFDETDIDSDISTDERQISGGVNQESIPAESIEEVDMSKYMSNTDIYVDIKELDRLELLPKWFSDIYDAISSNTTSTKWQMGYNKKRKLCVGNQVPIKQLRNLIIIDVSHSIPYGIAATMLTLIDTMKHKVCADVIITGGTSYFWGYEDELPSPERIRHMVPRSNEDKMFNDILWKLKGKEYNHVISFGDSDRLGWNMNSDYDGQITEDSISPNWLRHYKNNYLVNKKYTFGPSCIKVHNIHHYHTHVPSQTGYAIWAKVLNPLAKEYTNCKWCLGIKDEK